MVICYNMSNESQTKRIGVTHAIRARLNFLDERLWKRFSARRLELIDTLDLSSKKASEQEELIKNVADALRVEFNYSPEYFRDFDKLVRAAVQSVRRNRKRSSKTKRGSEMDNGDKRRRLDEEYPHSYSRSISPDMHTTENSPSEQYFQRDNSETTPDTGSQKFLSEIARFNSDSQEDVHDMNYSRSKKFTIFDKSRLAIDTMIQPRINNSPPVLPPISNLSFKASIKSPLNSSARRILLHYIEKSKTCSESTSKRNENLEIMGKSIISCCVVYVLEKSFTNSNETLIEYLRSKLNQESYLSKFYKELDTSTTTNYLLSDDIASLSLFTLLGSCVKDFGFDNIMLPLSECLYYSILQDYPLISQHSTVFNGEEHKSSKTCIPMYSDSLNQLNSLAAVATEMKKQDIHNTTKAVTLKFLSSVLEFTYPTTNSAPPKLLELIENAKSAFKLSANSNQTTINLLNIKDGTRINSDSDLETLFRTQEKVELELVTQAAQTIPIYEITSTIRSNKCLDAKIILPPPYQNRSVLPGPLNNLSHMDKANFNDPPPPPPALPNFQPLL